MLVVLLLLDTYIHSIAAAMATPSPVLAPTAPAALLTRERKHTLPAVAAVHVIVYVHIATCLPSSSPPVAAPVTEYCRIQISARTLQTR